MHKKWLILLMVISLVLVMFSFGSFAGAEEPIKIGFIAPLTGSLAYNGGDMKKGAEIAVEEINAKGGIGGRKIQLVYGDTEAKPSEGVSVVKKLITRDKVLMVTGGYCSSVNIATSEVCERSKVPFVVAVAISPTIIERGFEYIVRSCPDSPQWTTCMANWVLKSLKPERIGMFLENTDYGRDGGKIFSSTIGPEKVLTTEYFNIGDTDFTTQLSKLKDLNLPVVYIVGSTTAIALIFKQCHELDFTTQWVDMGGAFTAAFYKMAGRDGLYYVGNGIEPSLAAKGTIAAKFHEKYIKKYNEKSGIFSAQGYDAILVALEAIKRVFPLTGDLKKDREKIKNVLKEVSVDGVQGPIKFNEKGQQYTIPLNIIQIQPMGSEGKPAPAIISPVEIAGSKYMPPLPWKERPWK